GGLKESEYRAALSEKLELVETTSQRQNYAETFSYYCAIRAIMRQKGFVFRNEFLDDADKTLYEEQYYEQYYTIQRTLFTGGYRIYTSIDPELQEKLQASLDKELDGFNETDENGTYTLQGSAVCIDNETGRVCAIIGGRSQETTGYTLNRAYQSFRQTGSSTKPLIIYTPLFERGTSPEDRVLDEYFEGGPKNSGNYYYGDISVREAVGVSANTVAWKLFTELTPKVGLSYLLKMGFSHIVSSDYYPATSLGGFTYGASAVEMASAFATLENDGIWRTPTCIISIRDAEGKTIVADPVESKRVYGQNAARTMTDVMIDVMKTGTGHNLKLSNAISAGKTGTATNQCDGWFAGYTRYYTTAVWIGYDYPKKLEGLTGNSYPGHVWKNFMEEIHEGLEPLAFEEFTDPAGPKKDPEDEPSSYYPAFDAFGNPIDPETGLPYPTPTPLPEQEEPEGGTETNEKN
ncbi:MAG: glycosyl transferase, partial [Lachnospiraceae bacterium]|nr:glycosyl transferase [Lachnospiraceae bacterium]